MQIQPYIHFRGNCEAAFRFYEKALGGKIEAMMPYSSAPDGGVTISPDWKDKIMHVTLAAEGGTLLGCDAPPDRTKDIQGISIMLQVNQPEAAERIFLVLSEKGAVIMPLQKTFWSERFGMTKDQFGIHWMMNCSKA